jgi:hypothetical protein
MVPDIPIRDRVITIMLLLTALGCIHCSLVTAPPMARLDRSLGTGGMYRAHRDEVAEMTQVDAALKEEARRFLCERRRK